VPIVGTGAAPRIGHCTARPEKPLLSSVSKHDALLVGFCFPLGPATPNLNRFDR
jgi:hypothetical protein